MTKPYGMQEFDGYPMPNVPKDRKPLSKEEEDKILDEMEARIRNRIATQEAEKKRKIG